MKRAHSAQRSGALNTGVARREVWAWAMYDFANSGYTTVIITAVFSMYFVAEVCQNAAWATLAWTTALAISYALIMVTAPLLGVWADARASKKRALVVTTLGCVLTTAALAFVGRGDVALAMVLIVCSNYCFGTGENVIAAFLPELARPEAVGRVSGWGWSLGYCGGLVALGLVLAYVSYAQALQQAMTTIVPVAVLITAGLFLIAALPTFYCLRERAQPHHRSIIWRAVARDVLQSIRQLKTYPDLQRFLWSLLCYQAGIQTVIALAAIYAQQVMGFDTQQTITLVLVVNITAAFGAFSLGYVQDWLGHRCTILLTLVAWLLTVVLASQSRSVALFWVVANLVGLGLGSSQSAGRALVAYLSPAGRQAEFFGLWGLAMKASAMIGPLGYGVVAWLSGGDHRLAMMITGLYFIAGIVLVWRVDVNRGRERALA